MSVLVIGPGERRLIAAAIEKARAKPVPVDVVKHIGTKVQSRTVMLKALHPDTAKYRKMYPSHTVILGTFRTSISFQEQPSGLYKHLSVSSHAKGKMPGIEVLKMVAEAFEFSGIPPIRPSRAWVEEFAPGHMAFNIVELEPS